MMRAVLAEMALDVEARSVSGDALCRSCDLAGTDAREAVRARLLTPAVNMWCANRPGLGVRAKEWSCEMAMSKTVCCRVSIAKRRSTRLGGLRQMSMCL